MTKVKVKNILDKPLQQHSSDKASSGEEVTGYLRDGYCDSPAEDEGNHSVAAVMTEEFLQFTAAKGNNLRDKAPKLKAGSKWCLCANRWKEAFDAANGDLNDARIPKVRIDATNRRALDVVDFKTLKKFAMEPESSNSSTRPVEPSDKEGSMIKNSSNIGTKHV